MEIVSEEDYAKVKNLSERCRTLTEELGSVYRQLQWQEENLYRLYDLGPDDKLLHEHGKLYIVRAAPASTEEVK